jgi:hypothetical protein
METETTHSFLSCERDRPLSLLLHRVRCIGVVGMRAQPPFVMSGTLHGLDGEKAKAPSMPRIILGAGSEPSFQFSFMVYIVVSRTTHLSHFGLQRVEIQIVFPCR